jgi:Flp pilus assembly protein TadG
MFVNLLRNLKNNESGTVLVEFAFALPFFTTFAFTAIELTNYVNANTQVSQVAITLADNVSRAKQNVTIGLPQLREIDINDAFEGVRLQSRNLNVFNNGRVIITSLQQVPGTSRQWIAWQRCRGTLNVTSNYGVEDQGRTGTTFAGITKNNTLYIAPANEAIIFVEMTYNYKPLIGGWLIGDKVIRKQASYYVRDERNLGAGNTTGGANLNGVFNPTPSAPSMTCNNFTV